VDGLEFAALDPVQHRLAGDAQDLGSLIEADPTFRDLRHDTTAQIIGDADVPGAAGVSCSPVMNRRAATDRASSG